MKPKTKLQIEVHKASMSLKKISHAQKKWAKENAFSHYIYRTKNMHTCFDCGHSWTVGKQANLNYLLDETCPKCHRTLKTHPEPKKRTHRDVEYYAITNIHDRFQVIRYFHITSYLKAGKKADYHFCEVTQHWITPEGIDVIRASRPSMNMYGYNDGWSLGSGLEIRGMGHYSNVSNRYYINTKHHYPEIAILPEIRRNGYKTSTHGWNEAYFFSMILRSTYVETLLKAKQFGLLKKFGVFEDKIINHWPSVKICMRNNYKIKDADMWLDHLNVLEYFNKDIHNAKYICPENLQAEHQRLIDKRQKALDKIKIEEMRADIAKANKKFKKAKGKFFGIVITDGDIEVIVLDDVEEYYKEGTALHHCIFSSKYYEKPNTLILSARRQGQRLETIELDLRTMKIIQSRGLQNDNTKYHKAILDLVNTHIPEIKKRVKLKKVA